MTQLGKLQVDLEMDSSKFSKSVRESIASLTKLENTVQKSSQAMKLFDEQSKKAGAGTADFRKALKSTATELNSIWSIAQRVSGVLTGTFQAAKEGAQNMAAQTFFEQAGKNLEKYRESTKGLLSDSELMKKANLADSMGISEDVFLNLAKVANAASLKTGQSFDYMFNSIVVGTARSSRLLLDNLGIIVSQKTANENYAKALKGGTDAAKYQHLTVSQLADALTDEAKKRAFANEVMKQSEGMTLEMAAAGELLADDYARMEAVIENAKDAFKRLAAVLLSVLGPAFAWAAEKLSELTDGWRYFLKEGNFSGESALQKQLETTADAAQVLRDKLDALKATKASQTQLSFLQLEKSQREQPGKAIDTAAARKRVSDAIASAYEDQIQDITNQLRRLRGLPEVKVSGSKPTGPEIEDKDPKGRGRSRYERMFNADGTPRKKMDYDFVQPPEEGSALQDLSAWVNALSPDVRDMWNRAAEEAFGRDQTVMERFNELLKAFTESEAAATERARAEAERAFKQAEWTGSQAGINAAAPFVQAAGSGDAGGAIGALVSGIQTALADSTSVISQFLTSLLGDLAGPVGAIIGLIISVLGPAVAALEPVVSLFGSIGKMVGELVRLGFQPLLETLRPLETVFITLGISLGALIGALLGPSVDILQYVLPWLALGLTGVAAALMFLEPIVRLFSDIFFLGVGALTGFLDGLLGINLMSATFVEGANSIRLFSWTLLTAAMDFNNFIVTMMRKVLGDKYGDKYSAQERDKIRQAIFGTDNGPVEDNNDAVKENTKAVRDLAREFKNLPSGYKIAGADFATSRGTPRPVVGGVLSGDAASWANQRAGDAYRWRR